MDDASLVEWNRKNEMLLRKGGIELTRNRLDGAYIRFDDIPDRNILIAKSGNIYAINEGHISRNFSVHRVSVEITGRRYGYVHYQGMEGYDETTVRVRVVFLDRDASGESNLGTLMISGNQGRLDNINHHYNLEYKVRPRIEDVEEFGE